MDTNFIKSTVGHEFSARYNLFTDPSLMRGTAKETDTLQDDGEAVENNLDTEDAREVVRTRGEISNNHSRVKQNSASLDVPENISNKEVQPLVRLEEREIKLAGVIQTKNSSKKQSVTKILADSSLIGKNKVYSYSSKHLYNTLQLDNRFNDGKKSIVGNKSSDMKNNSLKRNSISPKLTKTGDNSGLEKTDKRTFVKKNIEGIHRQSLSGGRSLSKLYNYGSEYEDSLGTRKSITRSIKDRKTEKRSEHEIVESVNKRSFDDIGDFFSKYFTHKVPSHTKKRKPQYPKKDVRPYMGVGEGLANNRTNDGLDKEENVDKFLPKDKHLHPLSPFNLSQLNPEQDLRDVDSRKSKPQSTLVESFPNSVRGSSVDDRIRKTNNDKYVVGDFTNVTCPQPKGAKFANVEVKGVGTDAVAVYKCHEGYFGSTLMLRKCNRLGQWSGVSPVCIKGKLEQVCILVPDIIAMSL